MQCRHCGCDNPTDNFFCGHCGSPLLRRDAPPARLTTTADGGTNQDTKKLSAQPVPAANFSDVLADQPPASQKFSGATLSGPSLLGLSDNAGEADGDLDYLLEEIPRRSYVRWIVALLILAGFVGFLAYQWRQSPAWYSAILKPFTKPQSAPPPATTQLPLAAVPNIGHPNPTPPPANQAHSPESPATPSTGTKTATPPAQASGDSPAEAAGMSQPAGSPSTATRTTPEANEDAAAPALPPHTNEAEKLYAKGMAYLNGKGVPRNCRQALVYLNGAADHGSAKATSQLGGLYATGHCVPLDRVKAYEFLTRARNQQDTRNVYLEQSRAMVWDEMSPEEQARATR